MVDQFVLVSAARIDEACDGLLDFAADFRALAVRLGPVMVGDASLRERVERSLARLEDTVSSTWALRMVPVAPALEDMVAHAHALAGELGKKVRVEIHAGGAEVERSVLDALSEPLLHLVRNAIDHGLEAPSQRGDKTPEGVLSLRASVQGNHLVLEVSDDGRGVDLPAVRARALEVGLLAPSDAPSDAQLVELLFHHGLSTRTVATSVSGRGVGLDVVRARLEALNGSVQVTDTGRRGTTFTLRLPTSLSRERVLVVECGGRLFGLPATHVLEVVRLREVQLEVVPGGRLLPLRDEKLPLRSLLGALGDTGTVRDDAWAVVLQSGSRRVALTIERPLGQQDLLRRPVDALLESMATLSGSALLDDGRLVLLLTPHVVLERSSASLQRDAQPVVERRQRVLVVDDSLTVCNLIHELLAEAGFEVTEAHDGAQALTAIRAQVPDLMVADVDMPVMNGFELLGAVRERWQFPVVMLTMRGSPEDRRRAVSLGANAYLVKSQFDEQTLADTVNRLLGKGA